MDLASLASLTAHVSAVTTGVPERSLLEVLGGVARERRRVHCECDMSHFVDAVLAPIEEIASKAPSTAISSLRELFEQREQTVDDRSNANVDAALSFFIVCPDCGKQVSFHGHCPKCGGTSWMPAGVRVKSIREIRFPGFPGRS